MATTPRGIVYPTTGDTITPLANRFSALATSADTAIGNAQVSFVGTNADRLALVAPQLREGIRFRTNDTDRDWYYDGTNWLVADAGQYLIYPSTVTGGTVAADGTINFSGTAQVILDGIFSSRFQRYEIVYRHSHSANSGAAVQMRAGGTTYSGANYSEQRLAVTGTSITANAPTAQTSWGAASLSAPGYLAGSLSFISPATTGTPKYYSQQGQIAPGMGISNIQGWLGSVDNSVYDGFRYYLTTGGATFTSGYMKVYAYA